MPDIRNDLIRKNKGKTQRVITLLLLLIGIMLIFISFQFSMTEATGMILLTSGATFTAAALFSAIMIAAGMHDLRENAEELASVMGSKLGMHCAERYKLVQSAFTRKPFYACTKCD
jgi:hypothetical protein